MRISWLLVALALAGSTAEAQSQGATSDSLRNGHHGHMLGAKDFESFARLSDSLAALVDTIVVLSPDSIVVHVGDPFEFLEFIRTEARRASGEVLRGTGEWRDIEDKSIVGYGKAGLTALRVGRTRVVLTVESRNKVHAPPSCVPVIVIP